MPVSFHTSINSIDIKTIKEFKKKVYSKLNMNVMPLARGRSFPCLEELAPEALESQSIKHSTK